MNAPLTLRKLLLVALLAVSGLVSPAQEKPLTIHNGQIEVIFDAGSGKFSLARRSRHQVFVKDGRFAGGSGQARITTIGHKDFGQGQAIEVTHSDGNREAIMLFSKLPFVLFKTSLHNATGEASVTQKLPTVSTVVELGKPAGELKTLGTGGLLAPDKNPGSYVWLAVAEPQSRNAVVFGWLTENRGGGVLFSQVVGESVRVKAQLDYGHLRLAPGATEPLETLAIGWFEDGRLGLETWADTLAKLHHVQLPPQPVGYCTWYSEPYGGASDETHLAEQSAFAAKHLAPFGFSVIQIDDHWQAGISSNGPNRNFTTHKPDGAFPHGMKAAADNIRSFGLVPGIWFMPFAGTYYDPLFQDHQDWFVKHTDGSPYETDWGGTCLDMTHPGARENLRSEVRRIGEDWGYGYFKMDGLWTGTATKQQYVNSGYHDDGIGDAVFHDPDKSNLEAYRSGLRLVRETVGPKIFILGCCTPQNMRSYGAAFGLVDAMRIGPDNGSDWGALLNGPTFGSRHYFLHGRVWYNDPDPVYVRNKMPLHHAQLICSWVTLSGQLNLNSEWLPSLSPERLDLLKRTMPSHGLRPRPADLFERPIPSLWLLTDTRHTPRRDVVGIFNWERKEQRFEYALDRLGLEAGKEYVAFDYWGNTLVPAMKGCLQITVPAESCCILAVRPRANHPQLVSTSRHLTQGVVDVVEEKWDASTRTLRGRSKIVAGDPYELRIVTASAARAVTVLGEVQEAGLQTGFQESEDLLRATISSPVSREVSWSVQFK